MSADERQLPSVSSDARQLPSVSSSPLRLPALVVATLICFSANSLLTRAALDSGRLDWASFTVIRLVSGTLMLMALLRARHGGAARGGTWYGGAMLAGYAVAFTYAYTRIGAAAGALLLFGAVQATMIGVGIARGERPARSDWAGVGLAVAGLLVLTQPGALRPDLIGSLLMIVAGVCWGMYSLLGRRSADPLTATTGNFIRAALIATIAVAPGLPAAALTGEGVTLAILSGAVASGIGYTIWYTALPHLAAWRAAIVQLLVPIITAAAAIVLLGEAISLRLLLSGALIVTGVTLTVRRR